MADATYQPKVYRDNGGDRQVIKSGGELNAESGATVYLLDSTALAATTAEINRVADVSARITTLTADTTLTEATHDSKILLLGEVGGNASLTVTLPDATGSGARFKFIVSVVNTSNYVIAVPDADNVMYGNIIANSTGDTPDLAQPWPTAADSDTITLNGTTSGGAAIGDWIELIDIAADTWAVSGVVTASGTEVTPFSAAVA